MYNRNEKKKQTSASQPVIATACKHNINIISMELKKNVLKPAKRENSKTKLERTG